MQASIHLTAVDYCILTIYFLFVLGIGFALKRYMKGSGDWTAAAALFHTLAITGNAAPSGIKGGALGQKFVFHSDMGKNFWMAIAAWTTCFLLTILISVMTKRTKTDEELKGLVYSLTPKPKSEGEQWYLRPATLGILVLIATLALNLIFA